MFRVARDLTNPFTRTAVIALAWPHRQSILRWGRSFWNELRSPRRIDPDRLMLMGRVLWAITSDDRLAKSNQLRQMRLDGSTLVVDAKRGWKGSARLVDELGDIAGITDAHGRQLKAAIETTSTT